MSKPFWESRFLYAASVIFAAVFIFFAPVADAGVDQDADNIVMLDLLSDPNAGLFTMFSGSVNLVSGAILTINADGTAALDPNGLEINGLVIKSLGLDATEGGNDGLLSGVATLPFGVFQTNTLDEASSTFLNPTVSSLFALGQLIDQGAGLPALDDLVFSYTAVGVSGVQEGNVVIVPEPASLLLMGMGGLLVLRRRRAAA